MKPSKVLIMGAAGRDFHNFNTCFRGDPNYQVVAFTATQIPDIEGRCYPAELAGEAYPDGIPIHAEAELPELVRRHSIDEVVFGYSDVSHEYVMHAASMVNALGADFRLIGTRRTMLRSSLPVVSICAVRTGCGKSQTTRRVAALLGQMGLKAAVVRHPMPYGDLLAQAVQRFADHADLDAHKCTIEEREEYEPHIDQGLVVYAGVDYEKILRAAEREADVILWDGGNNDLPFFAPDLHIVVADPHRAGHERRYHAGEANARLADVFVINKVDTAEPDAVIALRASLHEINPGAILIEAASPLFVEDPEAIRGKRVLVIEDGPTVTHGDMRYGAGTIAARRFGAAAIVDPRPHAVGSIAKTFERYPDVGPVLPAMGYGAQQVRDLEATIARVAADLVVIGTPIDLGRILRIDQPSQRVRYELQEIGQPTLEDVLRRQFQGQAGVQI